MNSNSNNSIMNSDITSKDSGDIEDNDSITSNTTPLSSSSSPISSSSSIPSNKRRRNDEHDTNNYDNDNDNNNRFNLNVGGVARNISMFSGALFMLSLLNNPLSMKDINPMNQMNDNAATTTTTATAAGKEVIPLGVSLGALTPYQDDKKQVI